MRPRFIRMPSLDAGRAFDEDRPAAHAGHAAAVGRADLPAGVAADVDQCRRVISPPTQSEALPVTSIVPPFMYAPRCMPALPTMRDAAAGHAAADPLHPADVAADLDLVAAVALDVEEVVEPAAAACRGTPAARGRRRASAARARRARGTSASSGTRGRFFEREGESWSRAWPRGCSALGRTSRRVRRRSSLAPGSCRTTSCSTAGTAAGEVLDRLVVGRLHQRTPVPSTDLRNLALLDDHLAALDDVARVGEHLRHVLALVVDRDVRVGPDAQVPLLRQPERPGRAGRGDDGDLGQRVLARQLRQDDPASAPSRGTASAAPCGSRAFISSWMISG